MSQLVNMADDGMLLNFQLPSDTFTPKQTFRGGNWKDRLHAKKAAKPAVRAATRHQDGSRSRYEVRHEELILPEDHRNKRARTGEHSGSRPSHPLGTRSNQNGVNRIPTGATPLKDGVISSLFTYNPTAAPSEQPDLRDNDEPVQPSNAPLDDELANFTTLGISTPLAAHLLKRLDVRAPTDIQRKAIKELCDSDTDAFIQAQTGSGKTLAYLLPIVQRLMNLSKDMKASGQDFNRHSGLFAIILSPTRELSKQISTVLDSLLTFCHWIVSGTVIGGEKKKSEKARLRKGLNVLVATPGRLTDHLDNTEVLDVSKVRWLVLDEGDRLMELGFEKDIRKIVSVLNLRSKKASDVQLSGLPERRTTILCSATLKANVEQLQSTALKDAVSISAENKDEDDQTTGAESKFSAPAQLKQSFVVTPPKQRLVTLVGTLRQTFKRKGSVMKCIVFMSCADSVDFHFELFTRKISGSEASEEVEAQQQASPNSGHEHGRIKQGGTIAESRTQGLANVFSTKDNQVQVFRLHGSLPQFVRTGTLATFTKCTEPSVLVCTDVASRGLDLPNVDLVIEYDPPFSKDDHLHRIGRTARAGREGRAMIFLMPGCEESYVHILKESGSLHPTRHLADDMLRKGFSPSSGVVAANVWQDAATDWQLDVERWAIDNPKHLEQARRAFQSHIRAYATHVAGERHIFDIQQLHLGHLAKAFALRDKPGSIRVPGHRPSKADQRKVSDGRRATAGQRAGAALDGHRQDGDFDAGPAEDEREARKRMHAKMRAMGGASEFNLG